MHLHLLDFTTPACLIDLFRVSRQTLYRSTDFDFPALFQNYYFLLSSFTAPSLSFHVLAVIFHVTLLGVLPSISTPLTILLRKLVVLFSFFFWLLLCPFFGGRFSFAASSSSSLSSSSSSPVAALIQTLVLSCRC